MSVQDLQLNSGIRGVLARHWIDLQRVLYRAWRGHVHLSGEIKTLGPAETRQETAVALQALESEVRLLRGVKSVQFELTNWSRDETGTWTCRDEEEPSSTRSVTTGDEETEIIDFSSGRRKG